MSQIINEQSLLQTAKKCVKDFHVLKVQQTQTDFPNSSILYSGTAAARIDNRYAVVVGGQEDSMQGFSELTKLKLFDLKQKKWDNDCDRVGSLPRRLGQTVVTANNRIFVFGGEDFNALNEWRQDDIANLTLHNDVFEIYLEDTVLYCKEIAVSSSSLLPPARAWHACANVHCEDRSTEDNNIIGGNLIPSNLIVIGGKGDNQVVLDDMWILRVGREISWETLQTSGVSPLPLCGHTAASVDDGKLIIVLGGLKPESNNKDSELNYCPANFQMHHLSPNVEVHILDYISKSWSKLATDPFPFRTGVIALPILLPADQQSGCITFTSLMSQTAYNNMSQGGSIFIDNKDLKNKNQGTCESDVTNVDKKQLLVDTISSVQDNQEELVCNSPYSRNVILVFGGNDLKSTKPPPSSTPFAIVDYLTPTAGKIQEIEFPNVQVPTAAITDSERKSVFIFGESFDSDSNYSSFAHTINLWDFSLYMDKKYEATLHDPNKPQIKEFENGDLYEGTLDPESGLRNGQGICRYHNGDKYNGEWKQDRRSGQGIMQYVSGITYVGQWENDRRHGYGIEEVDQKVIESNRQEVKYAGGWKNDVRHGEGVITNKDGSVRNSNWENGVISSTGRLENFRERENGELLTYEGELSSESNLPHGKGKTTSKLEVYVGNYIHGKRNGKGISTLVDGSTYSGEWKNGKRNGFGMFIYARTRAKYDGKWVGDVRCGRGKCTYANGSEYVGSWMNDQRHGEGRITFSDGTIYEGHWNEDAFCGNGTLALPEHDLSCNTELTLGADYVGSKKINLDTRKK